MTLLWYVQFFVALGLNNDPGFSVALNWVSGYECWPLSTVVWQQGVERIELPLENLAGLIMQDSCLAGVHVGPYNACSSQSASSLKPKTKGLGKLRNQQLWCC